MSVSILLLLVLNAVTQADVALTQRADHTPAANSPVCVDCRTQTLLTTKTPRRLAATHKFGRRPQRFQ